MALPSSGNLSLSEIEAEFGGATPPGNLRAYLKGAGYVTASDYAPNVPSSGTIRVRDFLGAYKYRPPRILFVKGSGTGSTYDEYTDGDTYVYSKDSVYKNPFNSGILIGCQSKFQGYRATASRQSDCLPDSEGLFVLWNNTRASGSEVIRRGNDGAALPWTHNLGGFSLNKPITDPFTGGAGRATVYPADLASTSNWYETCYSGHNPVEGYWTVESGWTPGLAGITLGTAFPSQDGDDDLYWVHFDANLTAITWTRGEADVLYPTRRVTITGLEAIPE